MHKTDVKVTVGLSGREKSQRQMLNEARNFVVEEERRKLLSTFTAQWLSVALIKFFSWFRPDRPGKHVLVGVDFEQSLMTSSREGKKKEQTKIPGFVKSFVQLLPDEKNVFDWSPNVLFKLFLRDSHLYACLLSLGSLGWSRVWVASDFSGWFQP